MGRASRYRRCRAGLAVPPPLAVFALAAGGQRAPRNPGGSRNPAARFLRQDRRCCRRIWRKHDPC